MTRVVLASASARRLELLTPLRLDLVVHPADIDESVVGDEDPITYVRRLSIDKADAVVAARAANAKPNGDELVIAADTTVDVDGQILGKPADVDEARSMLRRLAGRAHRVHTGVTLRRGTDVATAVVSTQVTFAAVTDLELDWYLATEEPFDKAGAYAIQGAGGAFVTSIGGSVSNVIGLPLATVVELARSLGVELLGR
jgi:septum formation protein